MLYNTNSPGAAPSILMVDDDPDDVFLTRRAFVGIEWAEQFESVSSGEEMFSRIGLTGNEDETDHPLSLPDIIILDLNLPGIDGFQILQRMRADERLKHLPVVVMSTSQAAPDVKKAYSMGANSFITKPASNQDMIRMVRIFRDYWFELNQMPPSGIQ